MLDDSRHRDDVAGTGGVAEVLGDLHLDRPRDLPRLVLRDLLDADALPVDRRRQRVIAQEGEAPRLAALAVQFDECIFTFSFRTSFAHFFLRYLFVATSNRVC